MTTGPDHPYGDQPSSPPPPPASPQPPYGQPTYGQPPYGQPTYPAYGTPGYPLPGYPVAPPNEGMAIAAMIVGIVSFVLACGYGIGLLGSPVALVLGRISMKKIDGSGGQLGGRGFAQAGFIMGIIGTVLLALVLVGVVVVVVLAANGTFDD